MVGRLATFVAMRLRGKHRADYTPNVDCGDNVVIINADKVKFTGQQAQTRRPITGTPAIRAASRNGQRVQDPRTASFPERILEKAVERMLPKESPLARKQMTHLQDLQFRRRTSAMRRSSPEVIELRLQMNPKNARTA